MSLETYSDILSAVGRFSYDRQDLIPFAPDFIDLCEAEVNQVLRCREQLKTVSLTPDVDGKVILPDDYLEFRSVTALTSPRKRLDAVVAGTAESMYPFRYAGSPSVFVISDDNTAQVLPLTSSDIELQYYAKIPALTEVAPTNWLLSKSPTLYLYGTMKHAAIFIGDTERLPIFGAQFSDAVRTLVQADKKGKYGERTVSKVSGPNP
ncbi:hypothetical protein [Phyllobacterium sp. SB3]|uniref:phage adaptor protein n=1 Tax=Phyllobacterium sp. SB3 TaxID=3156073 RepID=UPI0032AEF411